MLCCVFYEKRVGLGFGLAALLGYWAGMGISLWRLDLFVGLCFFCVFLRLLYIIWGLLLAVAVACVGFLLLIFIDWHRVVYN